MPAPKSTINLLPKKRLEERPLGKFLKWCLTYGRYIIIATEVIVLIAFFSRFKLDRELTDLHESIKQKKAIIIAATEFEKEVENIQERLNQIKTLEEEQFFYAKLMEYLEKIVPSDVVLERLSLNPKEISLSGTSLTNHGFVTLLSNFRSSKSFSNIRIEAVTKNKYGGPGLSFGLTADLNPER